MNETLVPQAPLRAVARYVSVPSPGRKGGNKPEVVASVERTIARHSAAGRLSLYAVPEVEHAHGRFRVSRGSEFRALWMVINGNQHDVEEPNFDKIDREMAIQVTPEEALRIANGKARCPQSLRPSGFNWPTA